jgi:hypothetical protein
LTLEDVAFNTASTVGSGGGSVGVIYNGGNAGALTLLGAFKGHYALAIGGPGGDGTDSSPSGNGGNGGAIVIAGPGVILNQVTAVAGQPGTDYGGGSGGAGADGTVNLIGGCNVPAPTPAPTTIVGCIVSGTFIATNNYAADGTTSPVSSVTIDKGIITAIS